MEQQLRPPWCHEGMISQVAMVSLAACWEPQLGLARLVGGLCWVGALVSVMRLARHWASWSIGGMLF